MSDAIEQVQGDEPQGQVEDQQQETEAPETEGGNPSWDALRSKLDPVTFKLIEPELRGFDESARKRVESVNSKYEPFKRFAEQNVTPELIEASLNLYGQINSKPEEVYEVLTEFLQKEGRLPQTQKEVKEAVDLHEEAQSEDESQQESAQQPQTIQDPRLDRAMQYIEQQQQAELDRQAKSALDAEIAEVKEAHPTWTDDDLKVVSQLTLAGMQNNPNFKFAEAAKQYEQIQERTLRTPRPGDSAPDLVSPTGGIPSATSDGKSWGSRSKDEVIDVVADLISRSNKK